MTAPSTAAAINHPNQSMLGGVSPCQLNRAPGHLVASTCNFMIEINRSSSIHTNTPRINTRHPNPKRQPTSSTGHEKAAPEPMGEVPNAMARPPTSAPLLAAGRLVRVKRVRREARPPVRRVVCAFVSVVGQHP